MVQFKSYIWYSLNDPNDDQINNFKHTEIFWQAIAGRPSHFSLIQQKSLLHFSSQPVCWVGLAHSDGVKNMFCLLVHPSISN